ncbi:hypothetical protein, partial [Malikia spinosa]|uniref:hypothetical protein n=1 Tax=Malikia spinosa TaxID=86180 RepID=UPI003FA31166
QGAQGDCRRPRGHLEITRLGPCKPGQKHGDVVMPGMPGGNKSLQDMMNDPRMRELMKRQGQDD